MSVLVNKDADDGLGGGKVGDGEASSGSVGPLRVDDDERGRARRGGDEGRRDAEELAEGFRERHGEEEVAEVVGGG